MKKFQFILVPTIATLIINFLPAVAQDPPLPCPPDPLLADVVDTPEKCMCFYGLVGSGLDLGDSSTYGSVLNDESVQNVAQTGQYVGMDAISEYLAFVKGGPFSFFQDYILIGEPLFLDMTGSTIQECAATIAERRRIPINSAFSLDNQEKCFDNVVGTVLNYTLTGNPEAPITVNTMNVWLPDEIIFSSFFSFIDTPATAEFVCDTIVNVCGNSESKKTKMSKKSKMKSKMKKGLEKSSKKSSKSMKKCISDFNELPSIDTGALSYVDGNTKGCRALHSVFARNGLHHCPHITFEAELDENGISQCDQSLQTRVTDLFTVQQLAMFEFASTLLELPNGVDIKLEACPGF